MREIPLAPRTVADFYRDVFATLRDLGIECTIHPMPVELLEHVIPLDQDTRHLSYEREPVERFLRLFIRA